MENEIMYFGLVFLNTLVFLFFLQLFNSNMLKERNYILDRAKLSKDESNIAATYHNAWHQWKFGVYFVFGATQAIMYNLITQTTYESILTGLFVGLFMWWAGDKFLNWRMGWSRKERGNKSGFDIISFKLRFILMVVAIAGFFVLTIF